VVLPLFIFGFVSTNAMVARFTPPGAAPFDMEGRFDIWKDAAPMLRAFPWTGCGLGAFEHGLYRFRTFAPGNTVDFAHNDYLQVLAELGWIGAILAAALLAVVLRRVLLVALSPDSKHWLLAVGLLGSLAAIGLHSLVDFNLYIPANALALAWIAGIAASPGLQSRDRQEAV
jgi:O-antigen ligase